MSRPIYTGPACAPYHTDPFATTYAYLPSLAPGIAFSILFGLIALLHIYHYTRVLVSPNSYRAQPSGAKAPKRVQYLLLAIIGAALECAGWIDRTILHVCPFSGELSTMEISVLIMGPAWTQALVYVSCWALVILLGRDTIPVPPRVYLWTSLVVDCVCLSLQAVGGGMAGSAADKGEDPSTGTYVMVAGIVTQLFVAVIFSIILALVLNRGWQRLRKDITAQIVASAMALCMVMMVVRGVYRSIELIQGWTGYLISNERYIIGLDAVPMVIAMGVMALCTPTFLLVRAASIESTSSPNESVSNSDLESPAIQSDEFDEKKLGN